MFNADSEDRNTTRPPTALDHSRDVGAGQAHPGHHVDLEEAAPLGVLDVEEVLQLEDAQVVDQDVRLRLGRNESRAAFRRAQVAGDAAHPGIRLAVPDRRDRTVHRRLATSVDHHGGAGGGEAAGDGEADAGGGTADDCQFVAQIDLHGSLLSSDEPLRNAARGTDDSLDQPAFRARSWPQRRRPRLIIAAELPSSTSSLPSGPKRTPTEGMIAGATPKRFSGILSRYSPR